MDSISNYAYEHSFSSLKPNKTKIVNLKSMSSTNDIINQLNTATSIELFLFYHLLIFKLVELVVFSIY